MVIWMMVDLDSRDEGNEMYILKTQGIISNKDK